MEDQFKEAFKEETADIIVSIGNLLVNLEEEPANGDYKVSLFRYLHTIKGSAGMFGYAKIASLVHDIESVLEPYKQGEINQISGDLITYLLTAMDFIKFLMDSDEQKLDTFEQTRDYLMNNLRQAILGLTSSSDQVLPSQVSLVSNKGLDKQEEETLEGGNSLSLQSQESWGTTNFVNGDVYFYRVDIDLSENYVLTGNRPHYLLGELNDIGEMRSFVDASRLPLLKDLATEKFYLRWVVLLASFEEKAVIEDIFLFVGGESKITVEELGSKSKVDENKLREALAKIVSFGFKLTCIREFLAELPLLSSLLQGYSERDLLANKKEKEENPSVSQFTSPTFEENKGVVKQHSVDKPSASANSPQNTPVATSAQRIRVDSRRLDSLVDLVGELVTIQARLSQKLKEADYKEIENVAEKLDFIVQELRDVTTEMRMIPIQGTFAKFQRLVRDLSQELGKKVEYITYGGETELDKNIIEKLDEPLVHLIRNSLDHGIEIPQQRLAAGKPEKAFLRISAQQNGANITIQVQDDGAGLNRELIAKKAVERGLVSSCEDLSDEAVYDFIFSPGFSTASQITNVSGRGVGLSVVRSQVESLKGSITLKSRPGQGTTFSMVFPLTLAIIDGFLVRVGRDYFVVPLAIVEACLELKSREIEFIKVKRGGFMSYRDKSLPCLELRAFFEIAGERPEIEQIVIVRSDQTIIGVVVDEVIGKHQTVIKSLGQVYRNVKGVSSATILGDGSIALLLDIESIVELNLLQPTGSCGETISAKEKNGVNLD